MRFIIKLLLLVGILTALPAHAAKIIKAKPEDASTPVSTNTVKAKTATPAKERLVLMPLRLSEEDKPLQGAMEAAIAEGLQYRYEVFAGEKVSQKARQIFNKESQKKECDETRCMQGIAEAFQAELIATASITKRSNSYFLALSIQNIFDNKVVYSKSLPCENCTTGQAINVLKELSGTSVATTTQQQAPAAIAMPAVPTAPMVTSTTDDADGQTWAEIVKGNTIADYQTYLNIFPKGRYAKQATEQKQKLEDYAKAKAEAEIAQAENNAWSNATKADTEAAYNDYLKQYPTGLHVVLAKIKGKKAREVEFSRIESNAWYNASQTNTVLAYEDYLRQYPTGQFVDLAREKSELAKKAEAAAVAAAEVLAKEKAEKDFQQAAKEIESQMVVISAGSFDMGGENLKIEEPVHRVIFKSPFEIGRSEITQSQWMRVMGNNPSYFNRCGESCPVERVSWDDVQAFLLKLNELTGKKYRLPTEAEWEYSCRAGGKHEYCGSDKLEIIAWQISNSGGRSHFVASKQANAFGLYDMSGNVWEWVDDSFHMNYKSAPVDGSSWAGDESQRVVRGGSYLDKAQFARSAYRNFFGPAERLKSVGFRLARSLP